ncbi:uncharacterized protein LOC101848857 [Aplysia californica]|uniref:Uncharacterized protein LOC101848857 n=1 Tax=Aplysia californica TaxID=6500 RepID=A0ABM1A0V6_APLCA|nr:uncharacterized protein LOC101848857 [Aplysia californica]
MSRITQPSSSSWPDVNASGTSGEGQGSQTSSAEPPQLEQLPPQIEQLPPQLEQLHWRGNERGSLGNPSTMSTQPASSISSGPVSEVGEEGTEDTELKQVVETAYPQGPGLQTAPQGPGYLSSSVGHGQQTAPQVQGYISSSVGHGQQTAPKVQGYLSSSVVHRQQTAPQGPGYISSSVGHGQQTASQGPGQQTAPQVQGHLSSSSGHGRRSSAASDRRSALPRNEHAYRSLPRNFTKEAPGTHYNRHKTSYDILLIGSDGHGKRETVNSIATASNISGSMEKKTTRSCSVEMEDCTLRLVYGPSVLENLQNQDESERVALDQANDIMGENDAGFHAIVVVIAFQTLAQAHGHKSKMSLLKRTFGEFVLSRHCVCLMTGRDEFERRMERVGAPDVPFKRWCSERTGEIQDWLHAFQHRMVLFDNDTQDPEIKKAQVGELVALIQKLPNPRERYTLQTFLSSAKKYDKASAESYSKKTYDLVLVGSEGQGKQNTVDAIASASFNPDLTVLGDSLKRRTCRRPDSHLRLVYGINVVNYLRSEEEREDRAVQEAKLILNKYKEGFDAILLVIFFANLSDPDLGEDSQLVQLLKKAFGKEAMKNYGVLVVTGGDEFRRRMRKTRGFENKTFDNWCEDQSGNNIGSFLKDFGGRVVLFDNDSEDMQEEQVKQLLHCLQQLPQPGAKYTIDNFRKASELQRQERFSRGSRLQNGRLCFLTVGQTGQGKSSASNAILGWKAFRPSAAEAAKTVRSAWAVKEIYEVKVVDGPALEDLTSSTQEEAEDAIMSQIAAHCQGGIDALLFIVRYNHELKEKEWRNIKTLRAVLGREAFESSGICIVTGGDYYRQDHNGTPFEEYCKNVDGPMRQLFGMFGGRVVLFDNNTSDLRVRDEQVKKLMERAEEINPGGISYRDNKAFRRTLKKMDEQLRERPYLREEPRRACSLLCQSLTQSDSLQDWRLQRVKERAGKLGALLAKMNLPRSETFTTLATTVKKILDEIKQISPDCGADNLRANIESMKERLQEALVSVDKKWEISVEKATNRKACVVS